MYRNGISLAVVILCLALPVKPTTATHTRAAQTTVRTAQTTNCPADITLDGQVDSDDLEIVLILWNHFGTDADLNNDLIVDVFDLLILLASWGPCTPQK